MIYLLDTNIISDMIRNPAGAAATRLRQVGDARVCTSILVAAELRYGCVRRDAPRLAERVNALLRLIPVLPFEAPADVHYARLRSDLERQGTPIGGNDMLIAAHALARQAVLVTGNTQEFSRVAGLPIENWLAS